MSRSCLSAASAHSAVLSMRPADSCTACTWLGNDRLAGGASPANLTYGMGGACPAALSEALCPPSHSNRLSAAPQIDCDQQRAFLLPGALLTILMFTFGVPYVFYQLTRRHTSMYDSLDVYELTDKERRVSW